MRTIPGEPHRLDARSRMAQRWYRFLNGFRSLPSRKGYNLTISHERKFVWFRVAKVGTSTLLNHFRNSGVPLDVERVNSLIYPVHRYQSYFKFAFVRSPWDRLVSGWLNKVVKKNLLGFDETRLAEMQTFENFVAFLADSDMDEIDKHFRLQSSLIDLGNLDFLGRMETFDEDMARVFERVGVDASRIESRNVSKDRKPYRDYYSDELADAVGRIYARDVQIFGYHF